MFVPLQLIAAQAVDTGVGIRIFSLEFDPFVVDGGGLFFSLIRLNSTLRLSGLYTRVSYTGNHSLLARVIIYAITALSLPFLKILPSDIIYVVSKRS